MKADPEASARAWRLIFGSQLHVGYFEEPDQDLGPATEALVHALAGLAEPGPASLAVDLGCGVGGPAEILARDYGWRVIGLSPDKTGLDWARRHRPPTGQAPPPEFVCAHGTAPPLAPNTFDLAWLMESAHRIGRKAALFQALHRILKPGGQLLLCDFLGPARIDPLELLLSRAEVSILSGFFQAGPPPDQRSYERLLARAGFEAVRFRDVSDLVRPTPARWLANLERHRPALEQVLPSTELDLCDRACRILERYLGNGSLGYGLLSARKPAAGPGE